MLRGWIWRVLRWATAVVMVLAVAAVGQDIVRSSNRLRDELLVPGRVELAYDLTVLATGPGTVTLPRTELTQTDGVWGLAWDGGYGQVQDLVSVGEDRVERRYTQLLGTPVAGQKVAFDEYAFPAEAGAARGTPLRAVFVDGPQGDYPAYLAAGDGDVWVIALHDRGQDGRRQVARILPTLVEDGFPVLVLNYRNDPGAPPDPDGHYHWGVEEWQEVEAAVGYAFSQGAKGVVLYGWGMGGSIAAGFVYESPLRARALGIILDSAVLDLGAYADAGERSRGLQRFLDDAAKALAAFRFDIKWSAVNQVKRADELTVPVLLMHGTADDRMPVSVADDLAAARPDLVTLERFEGAAHNQLWNADATRYERAVAGFLRSVVSADEGT